MVVIEEEEGMGEFETLDRRSEVGKVGNPFPVVGFYRFLRVS